MAAMVPTGIDFWASRRSPERLEPAMIPEQIGKRQTLSRSRRFTHTQTQGVLKAAEYQSIPTEICLWYPWIEKKKVDKGFFF